MNILFAFNTKTLSDVKTVASAVAVISSNTNLINTNTAVNLIHSLYFIFNKTLVKLKKKYLEHDFK